MRKQVFISAFMMLFGYSTALAGSANDQPKITSSTFGALQARHIGPAVTGGRIMDIEAVNRSPRIIWVATASGGVWKSTNGGVTFKPVFDKHTQSIGALAIDQQHPDTVWVGTGEGCVRNSVSVGDGIYKTTDGGATWIHLGLKDTERISDILIHPEDPNIVYVAALGHLWDANEERGVFKTTDGGKTWEKILYVDENTGCADLAMDPQEPNILYAAMWEFRRWPYFFQSGGPGSGLYKSTDGGKTWKKLTNGLPDGDLGRIAIAVAPSRPNRVYAVVEAEKTALYRSDDLGESWQKVNSSFNVIARPFYFGHLFVDPKDYNRVYKPGLSLGISSDGGQSFTSPFSGGFSGGVHSDHHALWINPGRPDHLLLGTDGGVYESLDRGTTWRFLRNLPVSQFYHVSVDMGNPYFVYGGLQDNGSWMGPSRSPNGVENRDWQNIGGGDGFHVLPDPTDSNIIYAEAQGGNLYRYDRRTGERKEIKPMPGEGEPEYRFNWDTSIALSPSRPGVLYTGSQFLFRSRDQGESWEKMSPDLTTNDPKKQRQKTSGGLTPDNTTAENHCTIFTIAESPLDSNVIWVGTDDGNLQLTRDGGRTWSNVVKNVPGLPPHTWVSSVEPGHHQPGTAYVTFDGHRTGDMKTYVYKTTDFGQTWQSLATEAIKGYAHVIREDLENENLLFLGTEFGLYVSLDGGRQWARFTGNLPPVSVRDIVIHPREADVILATHGRGIMIIDDITPLRHLTADILASDAALLPSRPTIRRTPVAYQQFLGDAEFIGRNPSEVASITYYLKKRHLFGDLRVEVYDPEGRLLKKIPGTQRRGLNRVQWNLRLKPPRVPPAPTLAFRALFGPMVPEGRYTVKLIKGKTTYTGYVDVLPDPNSPHSAEDRALQQKTVMTLYRMQEDLAYIAEAIMDLRQQAESRAAKLKSRDRLARELRGFAGRLTNLHQTLVSDARSIFAGDPKLREKVVDLYGAVSSYGGRPSESQLSRMRFLQSEIRKAESRFKAMVDERLPSLNQKLRKKKLPELRLMSREMFEQKQGGMGQ